MKRMSRFLPTALRPRQDADDHYIRVHHRFAMRMFRESAPSVTRYATNHAVAQLDLAGTFHQRPTDAWRFIVLEFEARDDGSALGGKEWLPAWAEQAIVRDHTNFLREVRPFEVRPEVLLDRRSGQCSTAKYLVEVEDLGAGRDATQAVLTVVRDTLRAVGANAFGLRLLLSNSVLREAEMVAVKEPGQAYSGRYRDQTSMAAIDEVYFDHQAWGEEFFASPEVRPALRARDGVRVDVFAVTELVGVDRT